MTSIDESPQPGSTAGTSTADATTDRPSSAFPAFPVPSVPGPTASPADWPPPSTQPWPSADAVGELVRPTFEPAMIAPPVAPPFPAPPAPGRRRRIGLRRIALPGILVLALGGAAGWGYQEHTSATRWRAQQVRTAGALQESKASVGQLQDEKTDLIDQRTELADVLATAPEVTTAYSTCVVSLYLAVSEAFDVAYQLTYTYNIDMDAYEAAYDSATEECDAARALADDLDAATSNLGL